MSDDARTRYGVATVDALGVQTVVRWFDARADAERLVMERFHGDALILTASALRGTVADHAEQVRRP